MNRTLAQGTLLTALCLTLAAAVLLSGCNTLANLRIENPRYSIRDVRPRVAIALPFSASTIDVGLTLEVDNPNPVGLRLDRLDFDLLVNGNHVVHSVSDRRIRIPAEGRGNVDLQLRFGYAEVQNLFRELADAIGGNRARYEIRGNAYYETPAGQLRFPVTVYSTP
ncbi:MAG TPA: LEA type 2 family protein [Thermoanaerobaculia bacterium]|nr:LEA type 2 family protein [Thermoanaerobaculia bacterium]